MSECRYETDVVTAAKNGSWTEVLRDHAASCITCAETALVVAALTEDVDVLARDNSPLPDPKAIWIRSRLTARRERSFLATRIITWTQRAAVIFAAAVGLFLAPGFQDLASKVKDAFPSPSVPDLPVLISGPAAVMVMTFIVMGLMALWNERSAES